MTRGSIGTAALVAALVAVSPSTAGAHTDTDVVAVPAGEEAEVTLRPTHGCAGSPTVEVRIRAPLEGARPDEVEGWTSSAEPDGDGNTVLTWTGGSLDAAATGAFPVAFDVPDEPGRLLLFPAVQRCADGSELAWISGDPTSEYPAPRVLVLPAGSEPAASIDDVAPDAPGRDQLVAIVDVDAAATTTVAPAATASPATSAAPATSAPATDVVVATDGTTTAPASTAEIAPTVPGEGSGGDDADDTDDGGGSAGLVVAALAGAAVVGAAIAVVAARRRRP